MTLDLHVLANLFILRPFFGMLLSNIPNGCVRMEKTGAADTGIDSTKIQKEEYYERYIQSQRQHHYHR